MTKARLLLAAVVALLAVPASASAYTFATKWGSFGPAPGQFDGLSQIAVDPSGTLYAADAGNHRVQRFSPDGAFLAKFGDTAGQGALSTPYGVAVSPDGGSVYVTDTAASMHVLKYTASGVFVTAWGSTGSAPGSFQDVGGVAVAPSGAVYVADNSNNRVQEFTGGGGYVRSFGSAGTGDGQFDGPDAVAVDAAGNVYVTDDQGNRVQKFSAGGTALLGRWGSASAGSADGAFDGPFAIAVDPLGQVWVGDSRNHRVQQFAPDGAFRSKFGSAGTGDGQFTTINGIAVNCHGIYVADFDADRIQLFGDPSFCPKPLPAPAPKDTKAPRLTVSYARTQHVLRQRGLRIRLRANENSTFSASATVALPRGAARSVRFRRSKASLRAGVRRTIKLGLSKRTLRRLRRALRPRHRTLRAKLTITARDAAGNSATRRLTIKIKR